MTSAAGRAARPSGAGRGTRHLGCSSTALRGWIPAGGLGPRSTSTSHLAVTPRSGEPDVAGGAGARTASREITTALVELLTPTVPGSAPRRDKRAVKEPRLPPT